MENIVRVAWNDPPVSTTAVLHLGVVVIFESAMELLPLSFRDLLREVFNSECVGIILLA